MAASARLLKDIGDWGEEQACQFLKRQGFEVRERNYHTTVGEIDIVAFKGGDYYFIEVKTRRKYELANDLAITPAKRHKLAKTIKRYCYERSIGEGGLVSAGLIVVIDRAQRKVGFRLAVL